MNFEFELPGVDKAFYTGEPCPLKMRIVGYFPELNELELEYFDREHAEWKVIDVRLAVRFYSGHLDLILSKCNEYFETLVKPSFPKAEFTY